mmetsp:Transcript_50514/g.156321  ORF Transcript_50514/g.156321 Transcript_50514/m.156321 type:complete len:197 (-) Transcript_50514:36-626(-)|eukprot:CAMPEP_0204596060 /NCGR_PEP_ID=MMETSP0661-20131031/53028_1 /ASSEMBLY_ACC=CAM_ASM_000606 /TAXON_ID=109239 /ORGANISM="Alexandrium margalefi, Strain AMGDE01CS-322" /LENGTH=196 /DNA_ID=CAMNT_0051606643 /DNA_START=59 /DNA_END=649 /DNA_ORIENTATION=+
MALSAQQKIIKANDAPVDALELEVATALFDLENNGGDDLKASLREMHITGAKEVTVSEERKAIVIFVPVPMMHHCHRVQTRLIRELEKKFSGKHVVILAQRRMLRKPSRLDDRHQKQPRPRTRTLTAVHEAILEDLVFPSEIVAKRTRVKHDGGKLIKVSLDQKDKNILDQKTETFSAVYRSLTGKDIHFSFPICE